jgi:hypothetical protein
VGFVASDEQNTGNIYVMNNSAVDVNIGDKVKIKGTKFTNMQSLAYIDSDNLEIVLTGGAVTYPEPTDITDKVDTYNPGSIEFIVVSGTLNGNNISVKGASYMVNITDAPASLGLADVNEHRVTVKGYFAGVAAPVLRIMAADITDDGKPLFPDDGKPVGHTYFEDDFAWATGGGDDISTNTVGDARNIYTWAPPGGAAGDLLKLFNEHGYTDPCFTGPADTRVIYFMSDYLKFSKTSFHGGLTHGIPIDPDTRTNVKLSVDKVTYKSNPTGSNTGNYDPNEKAGITTFALIVVIEGPGSVGVDDGTTKSNVLADMFKAYGTQWAWETANIVLYGVTAETKVTIKTDQNNTSAMLCRYYLDNLKFEKHSVVTP